MAFDQCSSSGILPDLTILAKQATQLYKVRDQTIASNPTLSDYSKQPNESNSVASIPDEARDLTL